MLLIDKLLHGSTHRCAGDVRPAAVNVIRAPRHVMALLDELAGFSATRDRRTGRSGPRTAFSAGLGGRSREGD
jgi:hypothetical protein